jgi:hypothetical protein
MLIIPHYLSLTCTTRATSASLPTTGSSRPRRASTVKSLPYFSSVGQPRYDRGRVRAYSVRDEEEEEEGGAAGAAGEEEEGGALPVTPSRAAAVIFLNSSSISVHLLLVSCTKDKII